MILNLKDQAALSFQTVVEMLTDRDFLNEDELNVLKCLGPNELRALASKPIFNIDVLSKVRIIYYLTKFRINDFNQFVDEDEPYELYIVITAEKLTTNNLKDIHKHHGSKSGFMQFFELKEVQFNITKHCLVPKHTVIRDEQEIEKIVENYNLKSKLHLPLILKTDPIARYFDIKSGQLVKIDRISPTAGEYVVYRCCV